MIKTLKPLHAAESNREEKAYAYANRIRSSRLVNKYTRKMSHASPEGLQRSNAGNDTESSKSLFGRSGNIS